MQAIVQVYQDSLDGIVSLITQDTMPVELVMFVKQLLSTSREQTEKLQTQFTDTFYLSELIKIFNMTNDSVDL